MLAVSLSSINPGKGQLLLLQAGRFLIEQSRTDQTSFRLSSEFDSMVFDGDSSLLRKLLSEDNIGKKGGNLKILVGSVGSKSNKVPYVKTRLSYLSMHSNLSKVVIWTPSTTRVASLYAAADVYVMNSQGIGETFGRVTIEAMAFGLPVLGTDSGGTREIVEHNITGLLHPLGRPGARILANNLQFLLENPKARQEMGLKGSSIFMVLLYGF